MVFYRYLDGKTKHMFVHSLSMSLSFLTCSASQNIDKIIASAGVFQKKGKSNLFWRGVTPSFRIVPKCHQRFTEVPHRSYVSPKQSIIETIIVPICHYSKASQKLQIVRMCHGSKTSRTILIVPACHQRKASQKFLWVRVPPQQNLKDDPHCSYVSTDQQYHCQPLLIFAPSTQSELFNGWKWSRRLSHVYKWF